MKTILIVDDETDIIVTASRLLPDSLMREWLFASGLHGGDSDEEPFLTSHKDKQ